MEAILMGLLIPCLYLGMLAVEAVAPGRVFPEVRWWRLIGMLFVAILMGIGVGLPLVLPIEWLAGHRLIDGTRLGIVGGALVGHLGVTLASYLWHRAEHRYDVLWRMFHQLHHAPRRVDISGVFYTHPLDTVASTVLSTAVTVFVLGLDPRAAALTGVLGVLASLIQHWNVRTPRWLGYIVQRPESHCRHHELNVHRDNYAEFPLWDILFGTFHNPASFEGEVGFEGDAPDRVGAMLLWIDVNAPTSEASRSPK